MLGEISGPLRIEEIMSQNSGSRRQRRLYLRDLSSLLRTRPAYNNKNKIVKEADKKSLLYKNVPGSKMS